MLITLKLDDNQLNDNDAIAIAGALKHNKNLRVLRLMDNNLTKAGWAALRKAEFDDTSLNSAADSNHTCAIKYPTIVQGLDTSEMNGDADSGYCLVPNHVRQKKVYSVLSSRNRQCSNVGHFDDLPVEVFPDMLNTIQQYSNYHVQEYTPRQDDDSDMSQNSHDVSSLSLVYEICRYWDKSLAAYELLSS
jgi:hypothetical protein